MNILNRIKRKGLHIGTTVVHEPAYWWLAALSRAERDRFIRLRQRATELYNLIGTPTTPTATTELWTDFNTALERSLFPVVPTSFLRNTTISATMVMTREGELMREQLAYLESQLPQAVLKNFLRESAVGHPRMASWRYMSSHNSIHHAYHLARFLDSTHASLDSIQRVVEWGGGYGNLARIFSRISPIRRSYVIIDTPILCILQWLYLSAIMGEDKVQLVTHGDESLRETGVIIIPAQWYAHHELPADLFISTWAISESPLGTQNDVGRNRNWFGARHVLLGFQESSPALPDAGHIETLALASGATISDLPVLKGQHYAFR